LALVHVALVTFECTAVFRNTAAVNLGGRSWQLNQRRQDWQYAEGLDR
jgi:hypothetical protein